MIGYLILLDNNWICWAAEEEFEVKVKPLKKGNEHVVKTTRGETVLSLKEKLEEVGGYPVNTQRLVLKGKALVNTKTIGEYGISEGTVVHLVEKAPEAEDKEKVWFVPCCQSFSVPFSSFLLH